MKTQDHFEALYSAVSEMVEEGCSTKAILAELCDEDPEYLTELIAEIRQAQ